VSEMISLSVNTNRALRVGEGIWLAASMEALQGHLSMQTWVSFSCPYEAYPGTHESPIRFTSAINL
jgi:hypothetical protein